MKKKHIFIIAAIAAALTLMLVACGPKQTDEKTDEPVSTVTSEPVTEIQSDDINMVVGDKEVEIVYTLLPETAKADEIQFIVDEVDEGTEPIVKVVDGKLEALAAGETNITIKVGDVTKVIKVVVAEAETPETPEKAPDKAPEKDKDKTPAKDTSPTKKPTDKNDNPTSGTASGNGNNGGNNKPAEKPAENPVNPVPEKPVTPPAEPEKPVTPPAPQPTTPPAPPAPVEPEKPVTPPAPQPTTPPAPPAPAPDDSMDNGHVIEDNSNETGSMDDSIHMERP